MANAENIQKVIDAITSEDHMFNMNWWKCPAKSIQDSYRAEHLTGMGFELADADTVLNSKCGTIACIGGHAEIAMLIEEGVTDYFSDYSKSEEDVANWLGMSMPVFIDMCYPPPHLYNNIKRSDAIRFLESVRDGIYDDWYTILGLEEEVE